MIEVHEIITRIVVLDLSGDANCNGIVWQCFSYDCVRTYRDVVAYPNISEDLRTGTNVHTVAYRRNSLLATTTLTDSDTLRYVAALPHTYAARQYDLAKVSDIEASTYGRCKRNLDTRDNLYVLLQ
jgi:hypothetical protein